MENSPFHRLSALLWGLIVTLTVLFAVYVSAGRWLASNLGFYQQEILAEFNRRTPFDVQAERVRGEWRSFTPELVFSGLRVSVPGSGQRPLELSEGRIGLDVFASLRTQSPRATRMELRGLSLAGELDDQGRFHLAGFAGGGPAEWVRDFLLDIGHLALSDTTLLLSLPGGEQRLMDLELDLSRMGSRRTLDARLVSTGGARITALAEGVGNPFRPQDFTGELYLDIDSINLGAVSDLFAAGPPPVWGEGSLDLEAWLTWNRGEVALETRAEARGLRIAPAEGDWEIPLERVALEARLVERRNRWTLYASDLQLENQGVTVLLPRLQLDAWGETLRLRATGVELAPLNTLVTGAGIVPSGLADALRVLAPRGRLDRVQLSIGDLGNPASDWEIQANFDGLRVDSWHGAPGVDSATGYLELADSGGFVLLDSRNFSMAFPTVFRQPLDYRELYGTIDIDWDRDALTLSSGLITARGDEGTARALFGLSVPLSPSEIGLQMDLLVGLEHSDSAYRAKYLPYTLNPGLQDWLGSSIGEGVIEQGGFIWRGSLRGNAGPLRTVQLFFNLSDTTLDYYPGWPEIDLQEGVLLIDDSDVSVWSDRAGLYRSQVTPLSAEAWMSESGQMMLEVDAHITGPAADGLATLNESPLRGYVGDAFSRWQLDGDMDTHLRLGINLGSRADRPRVEVDTRWHGVDMRIVPGELPVNGMTGGFSYRSDRGFSSTDLTGTLWGQPLAVQVQQSLPTAAGADRVGSSPVEVSVATALDVADLRRWLGLDFLEFARGRSPLDVRVLVQPGSAPRLTARSSLEGISLDLPRPWHTATDERRTLQLDMPLGGEVSRLQFSLDDGVGLLLDLEGGALAGGVLSFNATPPAPEQGVLRIGGRLPVLDAPEWNRFLSDYFGFGLSAGPAPGQAGGDEGSQADRPEDPGVQLALVVDDLRADRLLLWGREFPDVNFSAEARGGQRRLSARTSWLRGELLLPAAGGVGTLDLQELDLAIRDELRPEPAAPVEPTTATEPLELPDLNVSISGLRSGDRKLGHVEFELRSDGPVLRADKITGDIAGLRLGEAGQGSLEWQQGEAPSTELRLDAVFDDLGNVMRGLGYERIIETEGGRFDLDLRWAGAPQDFSLQVAKGSVRVDIGRGSFLHASAGTTGALKVVSILNLATIVQRLSLTYMFEAGIPFDSMGGEVYLHGGTIEVPRMDVRGASSRFQFSGVSEVASRNLSGELLATLPVASNLPWVAALAGGLPVAAGVYVVSKVFEKQVDRLSSAVYTIGGSWDDPLVEFDRIWDAAGSEARPESAAPDPQAPAVSVQEPPGAADNGVPPDPQATPGPPQP